MTLGSSSVIVTVRCGFVFQRFYDGVLLIFLFFRFINDILIVAYCFELFERPDYDVVGFRNAGTDDCVREIDCAEIGRASCRGRVEISVVAVS